MNQTPAPPPSSPCSPSRSPSPTPSPFRSRSFRFLFAASAVSRGGMAVGNLALPLVAIVALDASVGEVGLLATLTTAAFLLVGPFGGVWVDRLRKRPVMIAADLARALLLGWVPLAWWAGWLTLEQLCVVALLTGVGTVFFDVAALSLLPLVVGRERLLAANSALHGFDAGVAVAGPAAAGGLVALVTAPFAVAANAVGYLASACLLAGVRVEEPAPERAGRGRVWAEVAEGARFVAGHPVLRPVLVQGGLANLGIRMVTVVLPVVLVQELGLSAGMVGLFLAGGGVGVLLGATFARRLAERLGAGRTLWLLGLAIAPFGLVLPLVREGTLLWLAAGAWAVVTFKTGVDNVLLVSFRQRVTPDRLLGRMNASFRTVLTGALAVGSALTGLLGELAGPRAPLWAGALALSLVWVPIAASPLRTLRDLPTG
ncbi:MFS transporter [Streptomyces sp. 3MP-14]|uniref:MFS transporter n=1 Tax=Streptomyces mimosae TaxID=2586635 RepID=A0A5N5ZQR0_9ACTN|nr:MULTISPECIES: MFS transporter [Streptomyces]KAB8158847.1 MFS transporter [Streptomyces mimosae]KAB8172749.1 MFS transporter [Streptomyces sp. 3MP-14]